MAASKAGINSQSGERLGALDSTGLTGTTVAEQLAELKLLIEESGGSVSVTTFYSGAILSPLGVKPLGVIDTITPPLGQRVVLKSFLSNTSEPNITVEGSLLGVRVDNKTLTTSADDASEFIIGRLSSTSAATNAGCIDEMVFEIDEVVTIKKAVGVSTNTDLRYSYSYAT